MQTRRSLAYWRNVALFAAVVAISAGVVYYVEFSEQPTEAFRELVAYSRIEMSWIIYAAASALFAWWAFRSLRTGVYTFGIRRFFARLDQNEGVEIFSTESCARADAPIRYWLGVAGIIAAAAITAYIGYELAPR